MRIKITIIYIYITAYKFYDFVYIIITCIKIHSICSRPYNLEDYVLGVFTRFVLRHINHIYSMHNLLINRAVKLINLRIM